MIPYGRQDICEDDVRSMVEVLQSDFLTQGPVVPRFEGVVAKKCGAAHGVAVNSATSALHVSCLALGLGPGDWLWTSPITFVASANCGLYCGAMVDFVDIDPRTYNLSVECLEAKLIEAERDGCLPKILVVVHMCGQSCDMERIYSLSQKYDFFIIEDASHALGGKYKGNFIGSCHYSDITVFSFHPVKIITTGEGGMALTNSGALASKLALLRNHGITRDPAAMTRQPDGPWYYQQLLLGFNYRMTDIQAALGCSQMERLSYFVDCRKELARQYDVALEDLELETPWCNPDAQSAWHLYVIRLGGKGGSDYRRKIFEAMRAEGVGVNVHYIPVHLHPYFLSMGFCQGMFPEAERYYDQALTLPIYPSLTNTLQKQVVDTLRKVLTS